MVKIEKYGLKARLVEEQDAAFILSLRTDPKLSRFLHPTENDEEKQRAYIRGYKEREKQGKDYYFIFLGYYVYVWKLVVQRRTALLGIYSWCNYSERICV